ncbi:MAG TPA: hypothetical protein VMH47_02605, partial [Gaiellaceae bacterium]|nr:hypothetical protein [Gaiellaceae bacterium]
AHRGHYPAIDVLESVSRLANEITSDEVRAAASALRETLAVHRAKEDLISIGAYAAGSDALIDYAIAKLPALDGFLRQSVDEGCDADETDRALLELMGDRPGAGLPQA